jgi:hypothetical protein
MIMSERIHRRLTERLERERDQSRDQLIASLRVLTERIQAALAAVMGGACVDETCARALQLNAGIVRTTIARWNLVLELLPFMIASAEP